jgi:hypothetical protein
MRMTPKMNIPILPGPLESFASRAVFETGGGAETGDVAAADIRDPSLDFSVSDTVAHPLWPWNERMVKI